MRDLKKLRASACALVALGLLVAAASASSPKKAAARSSGIVIATPGAHGVVLVGADHQARKVKMRHRAHSIRPGAIVRVGHRKGKGIPVEIINPIPVEIVNPVVVSTVGQVKQTTVLGVAGKDSVRLADGTKLRGANVTSGLAALKPGARVSVTLAFAKGKSHVRDVKPKPTGKSKKKHKGGGKGTTVPTVPPVTSPPPAPPASGPTGPWWKPTAAKPLTLHWILDGAVNLSDPVQMGTRALNGATLPEPDVYDIDGEYNSKATVDALHARGKKVICYTDAGVYETYRGDANKFPAGIWGAADEGWAGSYWLDIRRIDELAPIMKARFQMCKDKGFDAIEPDEITGWSNNSGFPLTYAHQIAYNKALASWAHAIGMSIGLKGDLEQAHDLVNDFDWTLNEECYQYSECTSISNEGPGADGKDWPGLQLFSQQNKAVWIAEYQTLSASQCADSQANHFNTAVYKLGLPLNGGRQPCTGVW
jgi:hypothetical protein